MPHCESHRRYVEIDLDAGNKGDPSERFLPLTELEQAVVLDSASDAIEPLGHIVVVARHPCMISVDNDGLLLYLNLDLEFYAEYLLIYEN